MLLLFFKIFFQGLEVELGRLDLTLGHLANRTFTRLFLFLGLDFGATSSSMVKLAALLIQASLVYLKLFTIAVHVRAFIILTIALLSP